MAALAVLTFFLTRPTVVSDFEMVGQPFYEEFSDSSQAKTLEVDAVDPESATLKQFRVQQMDGVWRIPSHYDYPAEAADRLAATASSLIGLKRESLAGRLESDHERLGVVDPLDVENLDPAAAGKRISLKDGSGEVLVDLIVGRRLGDEDSPTETQLAFGQTGAKNKFYVRRPDEAQTYVVTMNLDLSTRFSDWIMPDVLQLESSDLRKITVDNYELEEEAADPLGRVARLFKKQGDQMTFRRDGDFGPWKMDDLDEATQQINPAKISSAVSTLDELKIVGVRPKTKYKNQQILTADLKLNKIPELEQNPTEFRRLIAQVQNELMDKGFNLAPTGNSGEITLVSALGEMTLGTADGRLYTLQFGKAVSGDEDEIEIGSVTSSDESKSGEPNEKDEIKSDANAQPGNPTSIEASNTETTQPNGENSDSTDKTKDTEEEVKNRYLMVRIAFDESLLGEKPVKPIEPTAPTKPEGYVAAEPKPASTETGNDGAPAPPDAQTQTTKSDDRDPAFVEYDRLEAEYDTKKAEYELKLTQFEDKLKEYDEKVKQGQQRVKELNERFGSWFYVISADNLKSLQLKRADIVSDKKPLVPSDGPGSVDKVDLPPRPNLDFGAEPEDAGSKDAGSDEATPSDSGQ